ncbi:cupin domain containing protein [Hyaloscypha variabilis]
MSPLTLNPLASLRVSSYQILGHNFIPNTSIQAKPLLIYHSCLPSSATASTIESHLKETGVVIPQWRYTMYNVTHFHASTHEVLCVFSGQARLCFGGESNPSKVETEVQKGDVIIIPAGVAHRLLDDFSSNFQMVGSYPKGKHPDMCCGKEGEEKVKAISGLGWFERDPLYGDEGPVLQ